MSEREFLLEGALTVEAAVESPWRTVHQLILAADKRYDRRVYRLRRLARAAGIQVEYKARAEIDDIASGRTHGGILARAGERAYCDLGELLPSEGAAFIVMLDGIEDPYNFAGAVRALYAAGVDGIVLRPRNWTSASAIVGRASAGAIERMPLAIADSPRAAADFFRERGLLVAGAARTDEALPLREADLRPPLFLLFGGERRGITRSWLRRADLLLQIPYGRDCDISLGAVAAAAVIAFEARRQRQFSGA